MPAVSVLAGDRWLEAYVAATAAGRYVQGGGSYANEGNTSCRTCRKSSGARTTRGCWRSNADTTPAASSASTTESAPKTSDIPSHDPMATMRHGGPVSDPDQALSDVGQPNRQERRFRTSIGFGEPPGVPSQRAVAKT